MALFSGLSEGEQGNPAARQVADYSENFLLYSSRIRLTLK